MVLGCNKCQGVCAVILLAAGILFLLRDLAIWDFWGISWWTVMFLWLGLASFGMRKCADCQAMRKGK